MRIDCRSAREYVKSRRSEKLVGPRRWPPPLISLSLCMRVCVYQFFFHRAAAEDEMGISVCVHSSTHPPACPPSRAGRDPVILQINT